MEKILILESDWRPHPAQSPTETRSAGDLYARVIQRVQVRQRPLTATACEAELRAFLALPENQRGPNLVVFSSHGLHDAQGQAILASSDGPLQLLPLCRALRPQLQRSLILLDACHLGHAVDWVLASSGALGVVGFATQVNWTASSAFLLGLLRHWQSDGVLTMQRARAQRPQQVIQAMQDGDHHALMQSLAVRFAFRA